MGNCLFRLKLTFINWLLCVRLNYLLAMSYLTILILKNKKHEANIFSCLIQHLIFPSLITELWPILSEVLMCWIKSIISFANGQMTQFCPIKWKCKSLSKASRKESPLKGNHLSCHVTLSFRHILLVWNTGTRLGAEQLSSTLRMRVMCQVKRSEKGVWVLHDTQAATSLFLSYKGVQRVFY